MIRLGAALSKRPQRVIFNSRVSARQHEAMGYDGSRAEIIPNGFDCDRFAPDPDAHRRLADRLQVGQDTVLIGLLGRYHPMKDHAGFLRAAKVIAGARRDVHFVLAGRGVTVENRTIAFQARDLGIDTLVHVLGEVDEVAPLVAGLDILCSASAWGEGFPNVVGEAMASGVPCVVTDVGDSAWVVGELGRVVPPAEPAALAAECRDLIEMGRQERMLLGMAGRDRVLQRFSLQAVTRSYETLYSEMLAGNPIVRHEELH
jgi:glycosyltransferase involved in cell wall biosynthesis